MFGSFPSINQKQSIQLSTVTNKDVHLSYIWDTFRITLLTSAMCIFYPDVQTKLLGSSFTLNLSLTHSQEKDRVTMKSWWYKIMVIAALFSESMSDLFWLVIVLFVSKLNLATRWKVIFTSFVSVKKKIECWLDFE